MQRQSKSKTHSAPKPRSQKQRKFTAPVPIPRPNPNPRPTLTRSGPSGSRNTDVPAILITAAKRFKLVWHSETPPTGGIVISWVELNSRLASQYLNHTVGNLNTPDEEFSSMFNCIRLVRAQAWGPIGSDVKGFELGKFAKGAVSAPTPIWFDSAAGDNDRPTATVYGEEGDWSVVTNTENILRLSGASILHVTIEAWSAFGANP